MSGGTAQGDRRRPELLAGYIDLDERSFEELLSAAVVRAKLIRFHDRHNQPIGDWSGLLTADETVILALVLAFDLRPFERRFEAQLPIAVTDLADEYGPGEFPTMELARHLDLWLTSLPTDSETVGYRLRVMLEEWIESRLRGELRDLEQFLEVSKSCQTPDPENPFSVLWRGNVIERPTSSSSSYQASDENEEHQARERERFLRNNFNAFRNAIRALQRVAAELMPESLTSGQHDPAAGLFLAFTKLFGAVQRRANRFTEQHRDFYYDRVLRVAAKQATADRAFLTFTTDRPDRRVHLPAGTRFNAGLGIDNEYIVYTADDDLEVNGAAVAEVKTLWFERDPNNSPENKLSAVTPPMVGDEVTTQARGYVTGARSIAIDNRAFDPTEDGTRSPWALFGAAKIGQRTPEYRHTSFGLAIASSALQLKEGTRTICLIMNIGFEAADTETRGEAADQFLEHLDRDTFVLNLTGESGWQRVQHYQIDRRATDESPTDEIVVRFELAPDVEPIVAFDPEVHSGQFDVSSPILKFEVNPAAYVYPYTLLAGARILEMKLDIQVEGIRDVALANDVGPLDATSPFNPFGPLPALGSYLIIGSPEAALKDLVDFRVDVEWGDLPITSENFADHYQGYGQLFDQTADSRFRGQVSTLKDGRWYPPDEGDRPTVDLFRSVEDNPNIVGSADRWAARRSQHWRFDDAVTRFYNPVAPDVVEEGLIYTTHARSGFFKITLSQPDYAFGHQLYPRRLTEVLAANARLRIGRRAEAIPEPPYTPLIDTISVGYRSVTELNLGLSGSSGDINPSERIFQLHPFGIEAIEPGSHQGVHFVPQYRSDGNLFLGISAAEQPDVLTLLFHLQADCAPGAAIEDLGIAWRYLSADGWRPLHRPPRPSPVVSDSTDGFLTSGIVTLRLPADMVSDSSVMPDGLYWLWVSVDRHPDRLCSVYSISTQALAVSRDLTSGALPSGESSIAAGSIVETETATPGLATVGQPAASFSGALTEATEQRLSRVSERVRHRNRAVVAHDYELLILEHFPSILKVKCFPNTETVSENGNPDLPIPGQLSIVVVPDPAHSASIHNRPLTNGKVIKAIAAFVDERSNPFVDISVRNAAYEEVQIRCAVMFKQGEAVDSGRNIRRLNSAINEFLSPWSRTAGYGPQFGWTIRRHDVETYIRGLDYVDFVTDFSMLQLSTDDAQARYRLDDTEVPPRQSFDTQVRSDALTARFPWSMAVPFERHYISLIGEPGPSDFPSPIPAEPTTIGELEIGSTFVIKAKAKNA